MTSSPQARPRRTVVGVITVHIDGMGNPYRFTSEDGTDVGRVCSRASSSYHLRAMAENARLATTA